MFAVFGEYGRKGAGALYRVDCGRNFLRLEKAKNIESKGFCLPLFVRVRGALHGKHAHTGTKGHAQTRRALWEMDGVNTAQGLGSVKDFHLKRVVDGRLCCRIEGCREKDTQSCHGNDKK